MGAPGAGSWDQALVGVAQADADRIEEGAKIFASSRGEGRHVVSSLKLEHFLPADKMTAFHRFFATADWSDPDGYLRDYTDICIAHVLQGGAILGTPIPQKIGRAVEEAAFVDGVYKGNRKKIPRWRISELVDRLGRRPLSGVDRRALSKLPMSQYAAWVTWESNSGGVEDPFVFSAKECADEIRASLGLSVHALGQPILLVVYASSDAPEILRPTCADGGLFLRFEPPPDYFHDHGLTKPWEELPVAPSRKATAAGRRAAKAVFHPRPEGVHSQMIFPAMLAVRRRGSRFEPRR